MSTGVEWQRLFTDFKRHASDAKSLTMPALDANDAEQFFSLFQKQYVPFARSGGAINVWEVVGIGTDEVRNCAVLGWLLDCRGSHGQGNSFLRWFLEALHTAPYVNPEYLPQAVHTHAPYRTRVENSYGQEGSDGVMPDSRVDIVVESDNLLLFIEAKVHAGETGNQLERYIGILRSRAGERPHALIFLTPDGRTARDASIRDIVCLRWEQLADTFEARLAVDGSVESPQPFWIPLVRQFCQHIRTF